MSDFIPMISSSPPPLDDTPSCDDWGSDDDGDDFGGFASAHFPEKTPQTKKLDLFLPSSQGVSDDVSINHAEDLATSKLPDSDAGLMSKQDDNISNSVSDIPPSEDDDGFARFTTTIPADNIGPFGDSSTRETAVKKTTDANVQLKDGEDMVQHQNIVCQSDISPQDIAKSIMTIQDDCCCVKSQQCSQDKVSRDSGTCSSEISPVTQSDDYQEFAHGEDNTDQLSVLHSNDGSAIDTTGVSTAVAEDITDNGFGSGTTSPSTDAQVETDSEPADMQSSKFVAVCASDSMKSSTTYQDTSAYRSGETVTDQLEIKETDQSDMKEADQLEIKETDQSDMKEADQLEIKDTARRIVGKCSDDAKEHSSDVEHDDNRTYGADVASRVDINCASETRTDKMLADGLEESNSEQNIYCSGEPNLPAESTSSELPAFGNESETVSEMLSTNSNYNTSTFQEITTPGVEFVDKKTVDSDSDIGATEEGTKADCDENGADSLSEVTKAAPSEYLGNERQTAGIGDDGDFCGFADSPNVDSETPSKRNSQQDDKDDGFSNFGMAADAQNNETENEFDAFSGFKDSGAPSVDGDWAAFNSGELPRTMEDDTEDDWAAFHESGPQTGPAVAGGNKEDEFGDFEEADFDNFEQGPSPSVAAKPVSVDVRARMEAVLVQCFSPILGGVDTADVSSCLLIEIMMTEVRRPLPPSTDHHSGAGRHKATPTGTVDLNVWNRLKDIEETAALKYTWAASATSRQLLAAIAVDPRNMLLPHKKQSMPAFAADLGLLEPSRGSLKDTTRSCDPVIIDTSRSPPPTATDPPPDIPPAEFDWNSSGLTNPLDARGCMLLDLDFLVIHGNHGDSDVIVTQSEALQKEQEILEAIETVSPSTAVKTLQPLESVLANMKFVSTAPSSANTAKRDSANLTEDAARVIQILPDLSFMHATVLMFPVKGDM